MRRIKNNKTMYSDSRNTKISRKYVSITTNYSNHPYLEIYVSTIRKSKLFLKNYQFGFYKWKLWFKNGNNRKSIGYIWEKNRRAEKRGI